MSYQKDVNRINNLLKDLKNYGSLREAEKKLFFLRRGGEEGLSGWPKNLTKI